MKNEETDANPILKLTVDFPFIAAKEAVESQYWL